MAITYPVDVANTRWAVYQVDIGEIIDRNRVWPRADGGEIQGLDPNFVYLLHVNDTPPQYDSRLFSLLSIETVDVPNNQLRLQYNTLPRDNAERTTAAENQEMLELAKHVSLVREAAVTRLMVAAILEYSVNNQAFPAPVQNMADSYVAKGQKIWQNRQRLNQILSEIQAGQEPNLDAGWALP